MRSTDEQERKRMRAYRLANARYPLPVTGLSATDFRDALKTLNLRQRGLAQSLGVETSTVNRWATGKIPVPQYAVYCLALIAELQSQRE